MKKKLLSLVLAGAMVASTSVSAFAAEGGKEYNVLGDKEVETPITVTGNVENNKGQIVAGTINVTVPTAAAFTIDQNGKFTSAPIEITSDSTEKVKVTAYSFTDSSASENITIVSEDQLSTAQSRLNNEVFMSLKLTGDDNTVYFKSQKTNSGIYKVDGTEYGANEEALLGVVTQGTPLRLTLDGKVKNADSYNAPANAVKDQFKLVLKIKQERKQASEQASKPNGDVLGQ